MPNKNNTVNQTGGKSDKAAAPPKTRSGDKTFASPTEYQTPEVRVVKKDKGWLKPEYKAWDPIDYLQYVRFRYQSTSCGYVVEWKRMYGELQNLVDMSVPIGYYMEIRRRNAETLDKFNKVRQYVKSSPIYKKIMDGDKSTAISDSEAEQARSLKVAMIYLKNLVYALNAGMNQLEMIRRNIADNYDKDVDEVAGSNSTIADLYKSTIDEMNRLVAVNEAVTKKFKMMDARNQRDVDAYYVSGRQNIGNGYKSVQRAYEAEHGQ